ncbi:MAG: NFACT family protein [Chloroflexi bacterium]|nr:NFACT family protein [Chloroflexota bacterium]
MNVDAITLAAICDELRATVLGGRMQHVHHPDELGLALELYAAGERRWIYCSAHPQRARLHLVEAKPPRTSDAVSPLLLLLRKYVDGAWLEDVLQPPLERIVHLRFRKRMPEGVFAETEFVVEAMGRQSNLILLDADGSILDAAKRITPAMSRVRTVLPQLRYEPPPPPNKLDPRTLDGRRLAASAGERHEQPAAEVLVREVNACSPLLAREAVVSAGYAPDVRADAVSWERIAAAIRRYWEAAARHDWTPTGAFEGERLVAYAPYALRSFTGVRPVPSISAAVDAWYGRAAEAAEAAGDVARKRALRQALEAAQDRLRAKRFSLRRGLVDPAEIERLRRSGEYLLTAASTVRPGERQIVVPEHDLTIALDPSLTAIENAQRYFTRYRKLKAAAHEVPAMLESVEQERRYLDEALTHLDLATNPGELSDLRAEWAELGYVRAGRPGRPGKAKGATGAKGKGTGKGRIGQTMAAGCKRVVLDGFEVLVGRSGKGNDALLGREAHPADLWLHARGVPGAHVLVRSRGRDVPEPVLQRVAALAAAHSQARSAPTVAVDYTQRRYVDRIKGAPPGLVNYRGERTIYVAPVPENA